MSKSNCSICKCKGISFIDLSHRLSVAAVKLRILGHKLDGSEGFRELVNKSARIGGLPVLVDAEIDGTVKLVCGACLIKHDLTVAEMEMPPITAQEIEQIKAEAREELGNEIAEYLQGII